MKVINIISVILVLLMALRLGGCATADSGSSVPSSSKGGY